MASSPKNFVPQRREASEANKVFSPKDRDQFIRDFAIQFMASWAATNYVEFCSRGLQKELGRPPAEDAKFLAEKAWGHWEETVGFNEDPVEDSAPA